MNLLPKSFIFIIFSFISLNQKFRGHSVRFSAIFGIAALSLFSNHWTTYFATLFIIATAVTQLDFLEKLAAIIRGDKNYFKYF